MKRLAFGLCWIAFACTCLVSCTSVHIHQYEEILTEATCIVDGKITRICIDCGKSVVHQIIPAMGHDWDEYQINQETTCTGAGQRQHTCKRCGYLEIETIPAYGHDFMVRRIEPTCTVAGCTLYICSTCHLVEKTDLVPPLGHTPGDWEVIKEATCTIEGMKVIKCLTCQTPLESETIPATGHTYASGYTFDETDHWHRTTCCFSDLKQDMEPHQLVDGACTICSFSYYRFQLIEDGQAYELRRGTTREMEHIDIPTMYNGKPVVKIGTGAFLNCKNLTSITIPEGITQIGTGAFINCSSLQEIHFPSTITEIENMAFRNCSQLETIFLPASVTTIGTRVFDNCKQLRQVYYEGTLESWFLNLQFLDEMSNPLYYGAQLYIQGQLVDKMDLPSHIDIIPDYHFVGNQTLTTVTIPSHITRIGEGAFYQCSNLRKITLPSSICAIDDNAFYGCEALDEVYYEGTIADWCKIQFGSPYANPMMYATHFYIQGKEITEIEIPDEVTEIGAYQFIGFKAMTKMVIPNQVTTIGQGAFQDCTHLTMLTLPKSVESIGSSAFYHCTALESLCYEGTMVDWCHIAFLGRWANPMYYIDHFYIGKEEVTQIEIPNEITSIGDFQFSGFLQLQHITIPEQVVSIGYSAFRDCDRLKTITMPKRLDFMGSFAFHNCYQLTEIVIPEGITRLEQYTFHNCFSLSKVVLPSSLVYIGSSAFGNCSVLTTLVIPDTVKEMGSHVFDGCEKLVSIQLSAQLNRIDFWTFHGCKLLQTVIVPKGIQYISGYAFDGCLTLECIYYAGTMEEWKRVNCVYQWNAVSNIKKIICQDGEIVLE